MNFPILTYLIFIPLIGCVVLLFMPKEKFGLIRWTSAFFSFIPMVLSFWLTYDYFFNYSQTAGFHYMEGPLSWISTINANYFLGVDGISVPMLFLTGLLSFISIIASFNIASRVKEYFIFFLLLETGMLGVFMSLDLLIFFVFWEI